MQKDAAFQRRLLNTINPFQFEELIAELLRSQGFQVFLTKKTGDGGRDIIASFYEDNQEHLVLVECKRNQDSKTFGPEQVRALLGQFYVEQCQGTGYTCAMLVTSAGNLGPSSMKIKEECFHLSLKDRDCISEWISDYGNFHDSLWVPKRFTELI